MCVSAPSGVTLYGSHHRIDFTLYNVDVFIHHPDDPENEDYSINFQPLRITPFLRL